MQIRHAWYFIAQGADILFVFMNFECYCCRTWLSQNIAQHNLLTEAGSEASVDIQSSDQYIDDAGIICTHPWREWHQYLWLSCTSRVGR